MTQIKDALAAVDPVRHERRPTEAERDRLRQTVVAAGSRGDAHPQARRPVLLSVLATLAVIGMIVATSSMWPRDGSLAQAAVGNSNRTIYLHPEIVVTNNDIERSRVIAGDAPARFWIDVRLNAAGAAK